MSVASLFLSFVLLGVLAMAEPLHTTVSYESQAFYLSPPNSSPHFFRYEIRTKGAYEFSEFFNLKINAAANYVQLTPKQDRKELLVNPSEAAMTGTSNYFDYSLGFWTLVPDGSDVNNVFDVIHGKDYRQPFASENRGSLGLLLNPHVGNFDWKLFYIPKNTSSLLPDTQSPWWPRTDSLPISNGSGTILIPDNIRYVRRNESEYKKPFDHNFGTSVKYSFDSLDLYGFYFSGANQIPQLSPHFNINVISITPQVGVLMPPVQVDLTWYRSEHAGGGFSYVWDPVILKTFCKSQKDHLPSIAESSTCSATLESSIPISTVSVHYFLQMHRQWKKKSTAQELETLLGFFEKSSTLGFLIDVSSINTFSGAVVYNEKSPSLLTSLRYERKWTDRFKSLISLNVISAQKEPLAKAYDQTDNISLKLSYDF